MSTQSRWSLSGVVLLLAIVGLLMFRRVDDSVSRAADRPHPASATQDGPGLKSSSIDSTRTELAAGVQPDQRHVGQKHDFLVRVLEQHGEPIGGATVYRLEASRRQLLGETDALGRLNVSIDPPGELAAQKPGYFGEAVPLDQSAIQSVEIWMEPEGSIGGIIDPSRLPNHLPDILVIAWPSTYRSPKRGYLEDILAGRTRGGVTAVSTDGSFLLTGLDPRLTYNVAAGGAGLIVNEITPDVRPGADPVTLKLGYAYGAYVRFVERDGQSLQMSLQENYGLAMTIVNMDRTPGIKLLPEWILPLIGFPIPDSLAPFSALLAYTSSVPIGASGPVRVQVTHPDYAYKAESISCPELSTAFAQIDISLEREGQKPVELANAAFRFTGASDLLWSTAINDRGLSLYLRDSEGGLRMFTLPVDATGQAALVGARAGLYHWQILATLGATSWSSGEFGGRERPLVVGARAPEVTLSADGIGALQFEILDLDGHPYRGPAVSTCSFLGPTGVSPNEMSSANYQATGDVSWIEHDFAAAPYRLGGLSPGRYKMAIRFPLAYEIAEAAHDEFDVRAGELTRVTFMMSKE